MFGTRKSVTVAAGYSTEGKKIVPLKNLVGHQPIRLFGYFLTKDNGYGPGVILCAEDFLIGSMPSRAYEHFNAASDEEKAAITSGRCFIFNIQKLEKNDKRKFDTIIYDIDVEDNIK